MTETKMLQAILDGQRSIKEELSGKIDKLDKKIDEVKKEVTNNTKRIDKLGLQLARLEDDAPTIDEFEKLVRRVTKLENKLLEN